MTYYNLLINKIKNKSLFLNNNNKNLFNFKKLKFWNFLFIISFTAITWLGILSILGSSILEKIINPVKYASSSTLIIEIYPGNTIEKTEQKYDIVAEYLKTQTYIKSFSRVADEELLNIIKNFNSSFKDKTIVNILPIIINVELYEKNEEQINTLRLNLSQKVNNVYLDSEKELVQRLIGPINAVKYFTFIIPLIALLVLSSIIFLIIYAILFSHKRTFETLVFLGVYKKTLILEFSQWIFINSLKSSLASTVLILLTTLFIIIFLDTSILHIPFMLYFYFILFNIIILPIISMLLSMLFVNNIINKTFKTNLM